MATLGYGSEISGENITVGEVQSVGFSLSVDAVDITSTTSKYSASVPTKIKPNTIFISLAFDGGANGETQKFVKEFKLKRTRVWTINFPSGTFQCTGYVAGVTVAAPYNHVIKMDITINLTGEPSFNGN